MTSDAAHGSIFNARGRLLDLAVAQAFRSIHDVSIGEISHLVVKESAVSTALPGAEKCVRSALALKVHHLGGEGRL